ncbi:hypothetical protein LP421_30530 (plasmid) [Rhizobium sp. RCAM05350]|nr:hypothetical protein LP421_30530 [Rhizobium sp. RCAM05350]
MSIKYTGTAGNDQQTGLENQRNILWGMGGDLNGSISGGEGNDYLEGGSGFDLLYGDAGNDMISGGDGSDFL